MRRYPEFVQELEGMDSPFFQGVTKIWDLAMTPGELDAKTKLLIAMALDALAGSREGVQSLAQILRKMGATDGQIAEALRISYLVAGNTTLDTFKAAFKE